MRVKWTEEKIDFLKEYAPWHTRKEVQEEFNRRFNEEISYVAIKQQCYERGIKSRIPHSGRFRKGNATHNKGKSWDEWMPEESAEHCKATQYKKGHIPHNIREIGSERVRADGHEFVKISDELGKRNFKLKSHVAWEAANGREVPKDHVLIHADNDKSNNISDNLVLVPKSVQCKLNERGYSWHDRKSLEACITLVKLDSKIYDIRKRERRCKVCGRVFKPYFPHQASCRECIDERKRNHE